MLDLLLSLSQDAIIIFDMNGRIVRANPAVETIFGYRMEELA